MPTTTRSRVHLLVAACLALAACASPAATGGAERAPDATAGRRPSGFGTGAATSARVRGSAEPTAAPGGGTSPAPTATPAPAGSGGASASPDALGALASPTAPASQGPAPSPATNVGSLLARLLGPVPGLVTAQAGTLLSNNGSSLISDGGGGLLPAPGAGVISNGGAGYRLRALAEVAAPVAGARVEVSDGFGRPLGLKGLTTAADGTVKLTGLPDTGPLLLLTARYQAGDKVLTLRAVVAAPRGAVASASVDPATTLVASRLQVSADAGTLDEKSLDAAALAAAATALAPRVTEAIAVAAAVLPTNGVAAVLEAERGKDPALAAALASAVPAGAVLPPSTEDVPAPFASLPPADDALAMQLATAAWDEPDDAKARAGYAEAATRVVTPGTAIPIAVAARLRGFEAEANRVLAGAIARATAVGPARTCAEGAVRIGLSPAARAGLLKVMGLQDTVAGLTESLYYAAAYGYHGGLDLGLARAAEVAATRKEAIDVAFLAGGAAPPRLAALDVALKKAADFSTTKLQALEIAAAARTQGRTDAAAYADARAAQLPF